MWFEVEGMASPLSIKGIYPDDNGGIKSAANSAFDSIPNVEDAVKMAMYSVSRISRLVDMYHGLHAALDKEEADDETKAKEESDAGGKRFSCPTCKRRNWQSIETFRTHKRACR